MKTKDSGHCLAIVCHDAGAANHIISWMKHQTEYSNFKSYFVGPGEQLWNSAFPDIQLCTSLDETLSHATTLLSGTGWASNIEHEARKIASSKRIKSISLIDHWANYRERFLRNGEEVLPDEIWVVDRYAYDLANSTFPGLPVKSQFDYYTDDMLNSVNAMGPVYGNKLLYVSEPMRSSWGRNEAGEFQALRYFLDSIHLLDLPDDTVISLRLHPSEVFDKYDIFLEKFKNLVILNKDVSLADAISKSKWVVGCQTFALTLALHAERRTFSSLPPWAPTLILPHEGIIQIRDLAR